jgi:hypothetical protein
MNIPKPVIEPFAINNFEKGLNNVVSPLELPNGNSPMLLNVICDKAGIIETRPGLFKYILTQLPEIINVAFKYQTATFNYILLSSATKLYKCDLSTEAITEICAVSNVISGCQKSDKFYFVDGAKYREYNGTNVYEIIQPTIETYTAASGTISTVALPSTANATDDFYNTWEIYIASGTGYGQKKTITDYVGSTKTASVAWTVQPDATSVLYLSKKAQGSTYYDEGNKTVEYTPKSLEFADDFKGVNNINTANDSKRMVYHKQRFWFADGTNKNVVLATDLDNPYYVPNNMYLPPITNDGDVVVGLKSFNDALVIMKKQSAFVLYGTAPSDFEFKQINITTGALNGDVMQQIGNYLYYLGTDGIVYAMYDVRTDVKKLMSIPISSGINIALNPLNIDISSITSALSIAYQNYYIVAINDKMMIYNTIVEDWVVWDNWNPKFFLVFDNELLMSNANKYLYRCTLNRFYVTETFTAQAGQTEFILLKGYINEAYTDAEFYINNVKQTSANYSKLLNNKVKTNVVLTGGETIKIKYYSLQSYNDDGVAYNCIWHTPDLSYGNANKIKKFRKIYLLAYAFKYFTTQIKYDVWIDYNETNTSVEIKNQIALWGVAKFGDRFIKRDVVRSEPIQINNRGRIIRYVITTTCKDNPFRIYEISGEVEVIR